mgnify:CR=1 FL=1
MDSSTFDFYDKTSLKSYNLDSTMKYQLNMLDRLDVFTRKHCENVGDLTCRLCQKLHCSKKFTEYCTICGYLHDIGKLFIPPEILQKTGKLTDEEYIQAVKDRVHDYGKEGRYIAWYRENNEERRQKGYETMYTESRKLYCD